jgi:hypothetical protein
MPREATPRVYVNVGFTPEEHEKLVELVERGPKTTKTAVARKALRFYYRSIMDEEPGESDQ